MPSNSKPSNINRRPGGNVTQLVRKISREMRLAITSCHADGHQWQHQGRVGAPEYSAPFGFEESVGRLSVCASCGSERVRWYTRSGNATNRYRYADGYSHKRSSPDDDPAPSRLEWRQRLVVTLFGDEPKGKAAAS